MRAILSLAACQLRLEVRDRANIFWMLIMPLAFIGLFGGLFRGENPNPKAFLRVADADGSFLSRSFTAILRGGELALEEVSPAALDTIRTKGRTLILPRGFSDSLAAGKKIPLPFTTVAGQGEERNLAAEIQVDLAIARMLAVLAEIDTSSASGARDVASPSFQARYLSLLSRPELIRTRVSTAGKGRAVPSGVGASAQAMLVLFLLMNASISGAITLTMEKQGRVLARLATLPITRGQILSGKILGRLILAMIQALIILVFGHLLYHVWWGPAPLALFLLLLCLGLAAASMGILLGACLRTPEQAGAISWLIPLFLGAIGGTWWPLEVVPVWMRVFGHVSPAAWAMDALHGMINFGDGATAAAIPCLVLLAYAAAFTWIGSRLLRVSD